MKNFKDAMLNIFHILNRNGYIYCMFSCSQEVMQQTVVADSITGSDKDVYVFVIVVFLLCLVQKQLYARIVFLQFSVQR